MRNEERFFIVEKVMVFAIQKRFSEPMQTFWLNNGIHLLKMLL